MQAASHFHWHKFTGDFPAGTVFASDKYVVARAHYNNDIMAGKLNAASPDKAVYVSFGGKEHHVKEGIEILIAAPGTLVEWVPVSDGGVGNVGPIGAEGVYVGRAVCPAPENVFTPGKIHPTYKNLYIPFGGEEKTYNAYEALFIRAPTHHWDKWNGVIPARAVKASESYYVIRAHFNNDWVPGKLAINTPDKACYVPYGGKENHVTSEIEILVHGEGAKVEWVHAKDGQVPLYTVGPMGTEGVYVGRHKCPEPEHAETPGKIHTGYKKLFIPWGGKETEYNEYEALVIKH